MALDPNSARFVVGVSAATGIDPRVLVAWVQQEGAYTKNGTGHFNYLNLKPQAGDRYSSVSPGNFEQFNSVNDAVYSTVRRINSGKVIKQTAQTKPTPRQQIAAIANSGWDQDHYGGNGGVNLLNAFSGIFTKAGLDDSYVPPAQAGMVAAEAGAGSAADWTSYDAGNAAHDAGAAAKHIPGVEQILSIGDFFKWIGGNWDRVLLVGGGVIVVVLGLLFVAKSQQASLVQTAVGKGK